MEEKKWYKARLVVKGFAQKKGIIHEEIEYMSKFPYSSTIGSLRYAMVCTRPDISHAVGVVSRYMNNPGK